MSAAAQSFSLSPGFKTRMRRAAGWLFAGNLAAQFLRLATSLLLTRLLMPEAFGLMAAVNTLYFGLLMFSDVGIGQAVVRSPRGDDPRFLGTAWVVQMLRGGLLASGIVLMALVVAAGARQGWFAAGTVYADARLPPLMAAFALCALFQGAESIRFATAQRDMLAGAVVRLELVAQIASIVLTVAAAWVTRSVWALLFGTVCSAALKTVLSHAMLHGQSVRPCWEAASVREIIGFGRWIFLSSILGFLALQGEKLILGGLLGIAAFGVFSIASNLLAAAVGLYSTLNGRVIFPALSQVRQQHDDRIALRQVYTRMQWLADVALGFASGLLLMAGHWLIHLLYDARYAAAGWMLQCLGIGLVAMRHQVLEQLMFALGRPGWVTANNALRAAGLIVFIPAGFALAGERGAVWGVVLSQFASWPLSLRFKHEQGLLCWETERGWPAGLALGLAAGALADVMIMSWRH